MGGARDDSPNGVPFGVIPFTPQPALSDRPARFPTPFDRKAVHPLARRAAMELMAVLEGSFAGAWRLHEPGNGKMFGVLVVAAPDGTVGYLRAFSGMVEGRWDMEGWAPPAFDRAQRDLVWGPGEGEMLSYAAERSALIAQMPDDPDSAEGRRVARAAGAMRSTSASPASISTPASL